MAGDRTETAAGVTPPEHSGCRGYEGPGIYRHYKGGQYEVIGLALQEDSLDKENDMMGGRTFVIYRPLTAGSLLPARGKGERFWARELSDFNQMVNGSTGGSGPPPVVPRFTKIGEAEIGR